jgi:hypothetical protein
MKLIFTASMFLTLAFVLSRGFWRVELDKLRVRAKR